MAGEIVSLTGKDTIQINDRVLTGLADEDIFNLEFPEDIITMAIGKDGNTIAAANAAGNKAEITLRLLRGSADDKYLNSLRVSQGRDLASFVALTCKLVKRLGDGSGNITNDTYIGAVGFFKKNVGAKSNAQGQPEQSVAIYPLIFNRVIRPIL